MVTQEVKDRWKEENSRRDREYQAWLAEDPFEASRLLQLGFCPNCGINMVTKKYLFGLIKSYWRKECPQCGITNESIRCSAP